MKKNIKHLLIILAFFASVYNASAKDYLITDFGAKADAKTDNTAAIQKAIDDCSAKGGGKVVVPGGEFASRMISLKSNINLHLEAGAKISAIANGFKYTSLVMGNEVQNVSVTGSGTLFGNGGNFTIGEEAPNRPYIIFFKNCKNVLVEDVHLLQSASWTLRLFGSEHVTVRGVSIYSHANLNNDGIDIDGKDIIITGCHIDSGDDAICLKSEDSTKRVTENITITNCIAASNCNLIKMGTGSIGGFKNISISNCTLRRATESPFHKWADKADHYIGLPISGISGIALEIVDGGVLDQVSITNITMTGVQTPLFMRLGSRKNPTGSFKNVIISNVTATCHSRMSSMIAGVPGFNIENVTLRDILINSQGGGTREDAERKVPEKEQEYPENRIFGWTIPASGLFVRHANNINIDNFQVRLAAPDARPALYLDDVKQLKATNIKVDGEYITDKAVYKANAVNTLVNQ
ncbi:glycosyl hydrolase family 28 protein [Mucilaginibacter sp. PAMB04274]|uniref:glycoside hydrolase family 28 protein n=1 Tax=Mucilaginibacter sp. PAMB04274 TaxID=3138568 RepID=UPI0031F60C9B